MKNSKFKKLIVLAMLGVLTGSISANAMEENKNEITTNQSNDEKIKKAKEIYEKIYEEDYNCLYLIYNSLKNDICKLSAESLIKKFDENCEDYKAFVKLIGFCNQPEIDANGKKYYKSVIFKRLDEAKNLIKNIETEDAKNLAKEIEKLEKNADSIIISGFSTLSNLFWLSTVAVCYELKFALEEAENKGLRDSIDKFKNTDYFEKKKNFLSLPFFYRSTGDIFFKPFKDVLFGCNKIFKSVEEYKLFKETVKPICFEKSLYINNNNPIEYLKKVLDRHNKLKEILELTHDFPSYDAYEPKYIYVTTSNYAPVSDKYVHEFSKFCHTFMIRIFPGINEFIDSIKSILYYTKNEL